MSKVAPFQLRRVRPAPSPHASPLPGLDANLFLPTLLLVAFGVAMVFSASYPTVLESHHGDAWFYAKRQAGFAAFGLLALFGFSRLRLRHIRWIAYPAFIVTVPLLIGVLILGRLTNGAICWYQIGPFKFQPSEMAKVFLVLALARLLADHPRSVETLKGLFYPLALAGLICGLVLMGKDFGTTAVAGLAVFVLLFLAGARLKDLLGVALPALGMAAFFIAKEPYRLGRIFAFLNPEAHADKGGYHIIRALIAFGSGGLFGLGFSRSREKFFYLPTPYTDSIFAVIGEELGLLFCLIVLSLFVWLGWRGLWVSAMSKDRFASLAAAGLTSLVLIQAATNILVSLGLIPLTGLPLPFISYGGSSLLFNLIAVGIVANISRHTAREERSSSRPADSSAKREEESLPPSGSDRDLKVKQSGQRSRTFRPRSS